MPNKISIFGKLVNEGFHDDKTPSKGAFVPKNGHPISPRSPEAKKFDPDSTQPVNPNVTKEVPAFVPDEPEHPAKPESRPRLSLSNLEKQYGKQPRKIDPASRLLKNAGLPDSPPAEPVAKTASGKKIIGSLDNLEPSSKYGWNAKADPSTKKIPGVLGVHPAAGSSDAPKGFSKDLDRPTFLRGTETHAANTLKAQQVIDKESKRPAGVRDLSWQTGGRGAALDNISGRSTPSALKQSPSVGPGSDPIASQTTSEKKSLNPKTTAGFSRPELSPGGVKLAKEKKAREQGQEQGQEKPPPPPPPQPKPPPPPAGPPPLKAGTPEYQAAHRRGKVGQEQSDVSKSTQQRTTGTTKANVISKERRLTGRRINKNIFNIPSMDTLFTYAKDIGQKTKSFIDYSTRVKKV